MIKKPGSPPGLGHNGRVLSSTRSPQAVLVVASARVSMELFDAITAAAPNAEVFEVWSGDPLFTRRSGLDVLPTPDSIESIPVSHLVLALGAVERDWAIGAAAAADLLDRFETVTVLRAGSVIVGGLLDRLTFGRVPGIRLLSRSIEQLHFDGMRPDPNDAATAGGFSAAAWSADATAKSALRWLAAQLVSDPQRRVGSVLSELSRLIPVDEIEDPTIGVSAWRWPVGVSPSLIDLDGWAPDRPWELANIPGTARVSVAERGDIVEMLAKHRGQLGDGRPALTLPGGVSVDATMQDLVADAIVAHLRDSVELPPDPFFQTTQFLRWLDSPSATWSPHVGRYWRTQWSERHDLVRAMPDPDGHDLASLHAWSRRSWRDEGRSALLGPTAPMATIRRPASAPDGGVNLVGYFSKASSLGHIARTLHAQLDAAGVSTVCIDVPFSPSPDADEAHPTVREARFERSLVIGSADSYGMIRSVIGPDVLVPERTDAYWFWELSRAPERHRRSTELVDRLIAPSSFVGEAYAKSFGMSVDHVPFVFPEPTVGALPERYRSLPSATAVLLVTFDYHSICSRKNPIGAIDAFRRAFTPGEGPLLLVKSTNAAAHPREHEAVAVAAMGRDDIVLWDEVLRLDQQMAVVQAADVMVSLHRSEGLGLHLAEAMWLGTPTIATNWSGNLDFQSDKNSVLIPARQIPVVDHLGIYDATSTWADPDLDAAAAAMRSLVTEPTRSERLADAGRALMRNQPSQSVAGTLLWNSISRPAIRPARSRR